jgi:hypothetical protein
MHASRARLTQVLKCSCHCLLLCNGVKATPRDSIGCKRIVVVWYTWRGAFSKPEPSGGVSLRANQGASGLNRQVRWGIGAVASNYHSRHPCNFSKKTRFGNDEGGSALLTAKAVFSQLQA